MRDKNRYDCRMRETACFVLFHPIKKRSCNLLCVLDLSYLVNVKHIEPSITGLWRFRKVVTIMIINLGDLWCLVVHTAVTKYTLQSVALFCVWLWQSYHMYAAMSKLNVCDRDKDVTWIWPFVNMLIDQMAKMNLFFYAQTYKEEKLKPSIHTHRHTSHGKTTLQISLSLLVILF